MSQPSDWFEPVAAAMPEPVAGNEGLKTRLRTARRSSGQPYPADTADATAEPSSRREEPDRSPDALEEVREPPGGVSIPEDEIAQSQARIAEVLGAAEVDQLEQDPASPPMMPDSSREAPPSGTGGPPPSESDPLLVKPKRGRGGRGWDWPGYVDEMLGLARTIEPEDFGDFRIANASMINSLRIANKDQWSFLQQQLAELERAQRNDT